MADKIDVDALLAKYDLIAYVTDDLGPPKHRGSTLWQFKCPFHSERSASFAVYEDGHYHCYGVGCGKHGDIITYVAERRGISWKEALHILNGSVDANKYKPKARAVEKPKPLVELSMDIVHDHETRIALVEPYLLQRNIPNLVYVPEHLGGYSRSKTYIDAIGKEWKFKSNRVVIPYIFNDRCYAMNERRDDLSAMEFLKQLAFAKFGSLEACINYFRIDIAEKEGEDPAIYSVGDVLDKCFGIRFYRPEGSNMKPYGVEWFIRKQGDKFYYPKLPYAIITEGEFDRLSARTVGIPSLAMKVGKDPTVNLPRLLQNVRLLFVAEDADSGGGRQYAEAMINALKNTNAKVRKMTMPPGYKDMNDLHKAGRLEEFLGSKPYYLDPVPYPQL